MNFRLLLCLVLLFSTSCASSKKAVSPDGIPVNLPANCLTGCATAFGEKLGTANGKVVAYSNCQSACVFESPNFLKGKVFAGLKWQCVEFARRWLIQTKGITFGSIDFAADLWAKEDAFSNVKTGKSVPVKTVVNGAKALPRVGDLLVYGHEFKNTGHVAVVLAVDEQKKRIRLGEENFQNEVWPGDFAREISYVEANPGYWLLDPYLLGWKAF